MSDEPEKEPIKEPAESANGQGDEGSGGEAETTKDMSEEELRKRLQDEMRRVKVQDVILQSAVSLVNLGFQRLGGTEDTEDDRDLDQASAAIEAVKGLLQALGPEAAEQIKPLQDALSQLQLNYVRLSDETQAPKKDEEAGKGKAEDEAGKSEQPRRRDKQGKGKLWTPPGS